MSLWSQILDELVHVRPTPPTFARILKLPYLDGWERGRIWYEWPVDADFLQPHGTVYGGYLGALADHTVTFAAATTLLDGQSVVTAGLNMTFIRPIRSGVVHVEGRVLHTGRQLVRAEALFSGQDGQLLVRADATLAIIGAVHQPASAGLQPASAATSPPS